MKHILRVVVAVTTVLTVASPAAAGSTHSAASDQAYVEQIMYSTSMRGFLDAAGSDTWFDWSTDYCSAPLVGNTGRSFNFTNACRRHDFGYRNLHLLDRRYGDGHWTDASRKRVDLQFLEDMRNHCGSRRWWDEPTCLAWAQTFYAAVRLAGNM
ncbi:MAG TPA: phospholipase A2 [Ilumatobacteraceae bacterium]|nr:phospholipase A2 [Ilumatobacteraceae bacterium]